MNLFELKDHTLSWLPETLSLKPFEALWKRDKTKNKLTATGELSFIFFFTDGRSDFHNILDEDERTKEILEQVGGLPENWKPDAKVMAAIDFYRERSETVSSRLLEDAEHAAKKISQFLRNVNLYERDEKSGRPVYKPNEIVTALKSIPTVVDVLQETRKKVQKELQEKGNARGSVEKGTFEDGI